MSEARLPDGLNSRAVLLGVSRFHNPGLPALPSVRENLNGLRDALTHPASGLLLPAHCRVVADPADLRAVGEALSWAAREAEDLLLVYFAGHGVLDHDGRLHLALGGTDLDHIGYSAVPIDLVKRSVGDARARNRVLVVDCCFSGQAVSAMASPGALVLGQLDLTGTYTLTSTPATAPALAPVGERYTAYTGAFLEALENPSPLSLDEIHRRVDRDLTGRGLPRPQRRSAGDTGRIALTRGTTGTSARPRVRGATAAGAARAGGGDAGTHEAGAHRTGGYRAGTREATPPDPPARPWPQTANASGSSSRPRRAAAKPPLVAAAAVGGIVLLSLGALVVPRVLDHPQDGAGPGPSPTTSPSTSTRPVADGTPHASGSPSGEPGQDTVVYRDKALTWPAAACSDNGYQVVDLDAPKVFQGYLNLPEDQPKGGDVDYTGCGDEDGQSAGLLRWNTDSDPQVRVGTAGPGARTAKECRDAAESHPLGSYVLARDVTKGTTWCVTTTKSQVAKVTFTGVGPPYRSAFHPTPRNPTFTLSVTLWRASGGSAAGE